MANFYGLVQGNRGMGATRLGTKFIRTYAASYAGAINVTLTERDGITIAEVFMTTHLGKGTNALLYRGPVDNPDAGEFYTKPNKGTVP